MSILGALAVSAVALIGSALIFGCGVLIGVQIREVLDPEHGP